jgi:hypothetical protein
MPGHLAVAAAALALPLVGDRAGDATDPVRFLDPVTLAPRGPEMPADTAAVDLSPDGRLVAALRPGEVVFYRRATGAELGRVPLPERSFAPSWIAPRRLLVAQVGYDTEAAGYRNVLTVVNPLTRRVIRKRTFRGTVIDTNRRRGRQVLVLARGNPNGASQHALVLDADGRTLHDIDLPRVRGTSTLNGSLVLQTSAYHESGNVVRRPAVYKLNVVEGTTRRRTLRAGRGDWGWLRGTGRRFATISDTAGSHPRVVLDRETLRVERRFAPYAFDGAVLGDPRGYVVSGLDRVAAYRLDGGLRWARDISGCADCDAVIGGYVYLQRFDGEHHFVSVLDADTGETVGKREGAYQLGQPVAGRAYAERDELQGFYALPESTG